MASAPTTDEAPKEEKSPKALKPSAPLHRHSLDSYELVEIPRSEIKNAPYNPRIISDENKNKLKQALEKVGLLAPLTWNVRTGNLVGGHKRIQALDAIEGTRAYTLRVAQINVSEQEEIDRNLLLNNEGVQGEWDYGGLSKLLADPALNKKAAGFAAADIVKLLGDSAPDPVLDEMQERVEKARELQKTVDASHPTADSLEFYLVVVFSDKESCDRALSLLPVEDNRYVNGEVLIDALTPKPLNKDPAP